MQTDREHIEALERTARLLAETVKAITEAIAQEQTEEGYLLFGLNRRTKINAALGRLDAVLSPLGVASSDPARPGTDGEGFSDG